jgi:tRNA-modifying protein YgfZ
VLSVIDISRAGDTLVIACEPSIAEKTKQILERYAVMDDVVFESIVGPAHQVWTDVSSVWTAPIVEGAGAGAAADDDPAVERLRIRSGFLRYGADVDEDHFPFETPLAQLLDYTKGCYVGQEPVFRVHSQGNAARRLHGFVIQGRGAFAGVTIVHPQKPNAGTVTSAVEDGDRTLALGYLHRQAWEGAAVKIGDHDATAFALPMESA